MPLGEQQAVALPAGADATILTTTVATILATHNGNGLRHTWGDPSRIDGGPLRLIRV